MKSIVNSALKSLPILALLLLTRSSATAAAAANLDSLFAQGAALLQQEKWPQAASVFEDIVKQDTSQTQAAFLLGQAYYMMREYRKAAATWEKVEARDYRTQTVRYNLASAYAQMRDSEKAFTWLAQALEAGFSRVEILKSDTVFAALRLDERFAKVLELADQNARPCEYESTYRVLDFWLGDWEVFVNENQPIGTSRIEKLVNGCALEERFEQNDGFVGVNLFYFNNITGEWKMIWVTGAAPALGGLKEKVMAARSDDGGVRFLCELPAPDGGTILDRSTITPRSADRVDMVIQQSRDGGDNWMTTFAGYYQRVKK